MRKKLIKDYPVLPLSCPQLTLGCPPLEGLVNLPKHLLTGPLKRGQHCSLEDILIGALDRTLQGDCHSIPYCLR